MLIDQDDRSFIVVPQSMLLEDGFTLPTQWYIINAFGEAVCFRARKREKAQAMADKLFGRNKYLVRPRNVKH